MDPVVRLRRWGSEDTYELAVGAVRIARRAELSCDGETWWIRAPGRLTQDGEARAAVPLSPGVEIGIGEVVLVAESARTIAVRAIVQRYLGWQPARQDDVDRALRSLRAAAAGRATLALVGEGDPSAIAGELYRAMTSGAAPALVDGAASARALAVFARGDRVVLHARTRRQLARCARWFARIDPIEVPSLRTRAAERDRLAGELIARAAAELGATYGTPAARDLEWLRCAATVSDLAALVHRLVAIRTWGITRGAARLNLTHGALSRWARRHRLAT